MLEYDKTDLSVEIDGSNANGSRECIIYHYWYVVEIDEF